MGAHSTWRLGVLVLVLFLCAMAALHGFTRVGRANERDADQAKRIEEGEKLFVHRWQANDPRSRGGDGLGPVYNEISCSACHGQGAIGGGGQVGKNVQLLASAVPASGRRLKDALIQRQLEQIHHGFRTSPAVVFHRFGTSNEYTRWHRYCVTAIFSPSEGPNASAEDATELTETTAQSFKEARLKQRRTRGRGLVSFPSVMRPRSLVMV